MAAEPQLAVVALHEDGEPLECEQPAYLRRPRPGHPAQRPAAPDAQRLPEEQYGGAGVGAAGPRGGDDLAKSVQVDRVGIDLQHIAAVAAPHSGVPLFVPAGVRALQRSAQP